MRLTKKYKEDYFVNTDNSELTKLDIENDHNSSQIMRNKLGQLEDIEEELGIDLITLLKALLKGVYVRSLKNNFHKCLKYREVVKIDSFCINVFYEGHYVDYRIKDYGKTWALTKEELE